MKITGIPFDNVHIVGGGSKNELLNKWPLIRLGFQSYLVPLEATAIGNILIQMIALKEVEDLKSGRLLIKKSFSHEINHFLPANILNGKKEKRVIGKDIVNLLLNSL